RRAHPAGVEGPSRGVRDPGAPVVGRAEDREARRKAKGQTPPKQEAGGGTHGHAMTKLATQGLAVYAGSFDPVTNGHIDLIERASKLFHSVFVASGVPPTRAPLFSVEERLVLLREVAQPYPNVKVSSFD